MLAPALKDRSMILVDKRVNFLTTQDQHQWLRQASLRDHLSIALRLRALIELAREDPEIARRVSEKATQLEEERLMES